MGHRYITIIIIYPFYTFFLSLTFAVYLKMLSSDFNVLYSITNTVLSYKCDHFGITAGLQEVPRLMWVIIHLFVLHGVTAGSRVRISRSAWRWTRVHCRSWGFLRVWIRFDVGSLSVCLFNKGSLKVLLGFS